MTSNQKIPEHHKRTSGQGSLHQSSIKVYQSMYTKKHFEHHLNNGSKWLLDDLWPHIPEYLYYSPPDEHCIQVSQKSINAYSRRRILYCEWIDKLTESLRKYSLKSYWQTIHGKSIHEYNKFKRHYCPLLKFLGFKAGHKCCLHRSYKLKFHYT